MSEMQLLFERRFYNYIRRCLIQISKFSPTNIKHLFISPQQHSLYDGILHISAVEHNFCPISLSLANLVGRGVYWHYNDARYAQFCCNTTQSYTVISNGCWDHPDPFLVNTKLWQSVKHSSFLKAIKVVFCFKFWIRR